MKYDDLYLTNVKLGEGDYWYTALPVNTDKEPPFIRPVKVGTTRYLAFFDVASETWSYTQLTNV